MAALAALSVTSCGDGDEGCGRAACGGEIAPGRYRVSNYCATLAAAPQPLEGCSAPITVNASGVTMTGQVTFGADKSYQSEVTIAGTIVETFPASCLSRGGIQLTCAQLDQALKASAGATFKAAGCTGTAGCTCTFTVDPRPSRASGTWATAGTALTLTPSGRPPGRPLPYCVSGSEVTIQSMSAAVMGAMDTSTMVLTRE
jgi:hypothetical protein